VATSAEIKLEEPPSPEFYQPATPFRLQEEEENRQMSSRHIPVQGNKRRFYKIGPFLSNPPFSALPSRSFENEGDQQNQSHHHFSDLNSVGSFSASSSADSPGGSESSATSTSSSCGHQQQQQHGWPPQQQQRFAKPHLPHHPQPFAINQGLRIIPEPPSHPPRLIHPPHVAPRGQPLHHPHPHQYAYFLQQQQQQQRQLLPIQPCLPAVRPPPPQMQPAIIQQQQPQPRPSRPVPPPPQMQAALIQQQQPLPGPSRTAVQPPPQRQQQNSPSSSSSNGSSSAAQRA